MTTTRSNHPKDASEQLLLAGYLKQLRLPTFVQNYRKFAEEATQAGTSHERFLLSLVEQEIAQRERNQQVRLVKAARFPMLKELADFDFSLVPSVNKAEILDLARGAYLTRAEPILMVGNPGLGKTHLAISLALAAVRQGHKVRFYNAAGLANDLLLAQEKHLVPRLLSQVLKLRLVVLDEFGFIPFSASAAQLMFQFCSTLYERVALIVTTNLRFADWTQVMGGDERLTAALLDRLTHRANVLEFVGESYRFRQRRERRKLGGDGDGQAAGL